MSADLFNIIFVVGKDRVDFLQGQVTQDIEKLDENTTRSAAFCNPKGRVIATCQLFQFNEKIGVIIHHTMSEIIINRLKKEKVDFLDFPNLVRFNPNIPVSYTHLTLPTNREV